MVGVDAGVDAVLKSGSARGGERKTAAYPDPEPDAALALLPV